MSRFSHPRALQLGLLAGCLALPATAQTWQSAAASGPAPLGPVARACPVPPDAASGVQFCIEIACEADGEGIGLRVATGRLDVGGDLVPLAIAVDGADPLVVETRKSLEQGGIVYDAEIASPDLIAALRAGDVATFLLGAEGDAEAVAAPLDGSAAAIDAAVAGCATPATPAAPTIIVVPQPAAPAQPVPSAEDLSPEEDAGPGTVPPARPATGEDPAAGDPGTVPDSDGTATEGTMTDGTATDGTAPPSAEETGAGTDTEMDAGADTGTGTETGTGADTDGTAGTTQGGDTAPADTATDDAATGDTATGDGATGADTTSGDGAASGGGSPDSAGGDGSDAGDSDDAASD